MTILIFFVIVCVGVYLQLLQTETTYTNISVHEAKRKIESNPDLVILDVRTHDEYIAGYIENATLIPLSELQQRLKELDKEKEILVYCRTGSRSSRASQILVDNGLKKVYNMVGGIEAWINAGYPIVKGEK